MVPAWLRLGYDAMARKRQPNTPESTIERHGSLAVAAIVAILPLVFWPVARDPNLAKPIFLALGLAAAFTIVLLRLLRADRLCCRFSLLDACVASYVLMAALSLSYSAHKYASLMALRPMLVCVLVYGLTRLVVTGERARVRVVLGLLVGCIGVCAIAIVQQFHDIGWGGPWWVGSTWFNRTFLAAYLLLLLPVSVWALTCGGGWLKIVGIASLFFGLPALVFTGARIAWSGVVPMACTAAILGWPILGGRKKRAVVLSAILLTAIGVLSQAAMMRLRPAIAPLEIAKRAFTTAGPGNEQRLSLMTAAVRVGLDRPIIGGGIGTFAVYAPERLPHEFYNGVLEGNSIDADVVIVDAHNELAQVFADTGLAGLALFLAIPVCAAVLARRAVNTKNTPHSDKWFCTAGVTGVVGFLCANLVGISARVPGEAAFYYLFLALIASASAKRQQTGGHAPSGHRASLAVLSPLICILLVEAWVGARDLHASIHLIRADTLLANATTVTDVEAAIGEYSQAVEATPTNPAGRYGLANALAVAGRHARALHMYRLVEESSPNYGRLHFNLGTSLYHLKRYSEAEREMALAYRLDHLPDSRERLAHLRDLLRREKAKL